MWIEAGLARLVDEFWGAQLAGPEPFPRTLVGPALMALPVTIHNLQALSVNSARGWLRARNIELPFDYPERRLRGCLIAHAGHGFVLVDASDADDERRFTVAHELAHFMVDYLEPRKLAVAALGEDIVPVLDGLRPPTQTERLHALLNTAPLGYHVDLMGRTDSGAYTVSATLLTEDRADRLALELLAPSADVWPRLMALHEATGTGAGSYAALEDGSAELLRKRYGLPETQAREYARWLLAKGGRRPGIRDWLA